MARVRGEGFPCHRNLILDGDLDGASAASVNRHRSGIPYEFCMSSCMHFWNFIRDGVPIGADWDPICMLYS
jgi:hypothetical protein